MVLKLGLQTLLTNSITFRPLVVMPFVACYGVTKFYLHYQSAIVSCGTVLTLTRKYLDKTKGRVFFLSS